MTHAFEGAAANSLFQQVRKKLGVKGKKRRRPPDADLLPIWDMFYDLSNLPPPTHRVEIADHPSIFILPRLKPLSLIGTAQFLRTHNGQPIPVDFWPLYDTTEKRKGWFLGEFAVNPLFRLLAKIAHCAAVACLGFDGFSHYLLPVISGDMREADELVGEMPADGPLFLPLDYPKGVHQIGVGTYETAGQSHVIVQIRLFSNLVRAQFPFLTQTFAVCAGILPQQSDPKLTL